MTVAHTPEHIKITTNSHRLRWLWFLGFILAIILFQFSESLPEQLQWIDKYPKSWIVPLKDWISTFMKWLIEDLDFGLFTFKEFTRAISWLLEWPLKISSSLFSDGFTFSSKPRAEVILQHLPWPAVILAFVAIAYKAGGAKLALLVTACFSYLVVFGQWESAMVTLSSIIIAVPLGILIGLSIGILGFRYPKFEKTITPILDLMQTVPIFAYLVPVLFLFGFGPVAAMIATIIYASPPMVRLTILALKKVPSELVEYGKMSGCTQSQLLWKVQLPSAQHGLMLGVNQVIMLSLNMVIIASMIGAGGLGYDVLSALRRLAIGAGLEAGIAITLLAISLDRISQAFAQKTTIAKNAYPLSFFAKHQYALVTIFLIIILWIIAQFIPFLNSYPESLQLTTSDFWSKLVKWININYFDQFEAVKTFLLLNLMIPLKRFLVEIPWVVIVGAISLLGYQLGGLRLAILSGLLGLFIVVTGQWQKAMITVYLCGVSVLFAALIGIPLGIWASLNKTVYRIVKAIIDTLQTLPSFVYLIPVVMLFRVGDFSAMIAIIAYSLAPAVRYTIHGISQVPEHLIEASKAMGCSKIQILRRVQLPIALPEIMLGINQTIMMALSMLVITALVGTRDLGQEVYIALTKADTGRGIVAGLAVAFIAIIADRQIGAWARKKKQQLGMEQL